jgi:small GTP-binding protein
MPLETSAAWLERVLGCRLPDPALLDEALTHRSFSSRNNERLEYLGDAVLSFLVAGMLYREFPDASEGELSRIRSSLVSGESLGAIALELGLGDHLHLGEGELKSGGFPPRLHPGRCAGSPGGRHLPRGRPRRGGPEAVERLLRPTAGCAAAAADLKDPKTRLQEFLQGDGLACRAMRCWKSAASPTTSASGSAAARRSRASGGEATGTSRRRAEQDAAEQLLALAATGETAVTAAHRCGSVALVGRPNVGKSTLLNALVGQKVSIVSAKPQTTRHRIAGVVTRPGFQVTFLDTPGLHARASRRLNQAMNRAALGSLAEADLLLFVVDATRWTGEDDNALERLRESGRPALLVVNKVDRVRPREKLLPLLESLAAKHPNSSRSCRCPRCGPTTSSGCSP